MIAFACG
jgi:hypothetical protein